MGYCVTEESTPQTFAELVAGVEKRRRTVTIYAPALPDALAEIFESRHVELEHQFLPEGASEPFLTVTEDDRYLGSVDLPAVYDFGHPKIHEIGSPDLVEAAYRKLTSMLPDTVFSSLDRRQLLATSREIEDRAWRVGTGRIDVGFQALSKLEAQTDVYEALAERGLDVHLYGLADWRPPLLDRVTVHTDGGELGEVWFMAFDGGKTPGQACGLVALEHAAGFEGFWTYDPSVVARVFSSASRFPANHESELP
ncbi:DICT sensory domain-containing protein [Salinigranum salinum]|uniref:DICT sensory domain-containing protein n=1 Tax=Salinigranum salinum TaxID=1364937 RepID=UPI00126057F7|nr:DICT sensory domain-containing protein [Salinigranum salinum]